MSMMLSGCSIQLVPFRDKGENINYETYNGKNNHLVAVASQVTAINEVLYSVRRGSYMCVCVCVCVCGRWFSCVQ